MLPTVWSLLSFPSLNMAEIQKAAEDWGQGELTSPELLLCVSSFSYAILLITKNKQTNDNKKPLRKVDTMSFSF